MKIIAKKGRTSLLTRVFIQDSSSSIGAGLTGLTNASSSLVCYRARDDDGNAGATQITLGAGTRGTWSSGGFVEKDATNMPGWYELGIPDNALASGSETVDIELKGAANMAPCVLEIQLVNFDPQDAVRYGLTALPNANAGAAGGVLTVGNLRLQKNTAFSNFMFRMTDSTDHISPKSGLVAGGGVTGQVSIDGAAFGALTNAVAEIASGWYKVNLAATDLNGNAIALKFTATGADQLDMFFVTQAE